MAGELLLCLTEPKQSQQQQLLRKACMPELLSLQFGMPPAYELDATPNCRIGSANSSMPADVKGVSHVHCVPS